MRGVIMCLIIEDFKNSLIEFSNSYKTTERSGHYIIDEVEDENIAFDEFYGLVKLQQKYIKNRYQ